jgi:2-methylcitrate dehydratase PrpD
MKKGGISKMEGITRKLCNYIVGETFETIPQYIKSEIKRRILDYCGVVLAGSTRMESKILHQIVKQFGGKKESTLIGFGDKSSCVNAALVNGTTSHIIELGDWSRTAIHHPGETMLSAALALGEREGINGKTLMNATVVGYETGLRIGLAGNPGIRGRGFHTIGTVGPFGAAAACSKILELDTDRTEQALGLAGSQSAGLLSFLDGGGAMSKRLQAGKANSSGLLAALLAREGFIGPRGVLESDKGFFKAFVHWNEYKYHPEWVVEDLGRKYQIMNTNIKIHSCCGYLPPGLDAIEDFMKEEGIKVDEIEKIVVRTFRHAVDGHKEISPDTIVGATMSYPYCVAVLLMTGKVAITEFTEKKLKDQEFMDRVREVGKKCEFIIDPELEKLYPEQYPAVTKVIMRDGKVFERSVYAPRGFYPEHPVSDDQVKEKFRNLAMQVISKEKSEKVISLIDNLEKVKDVGEIAKLLSP